MKGIQAKLERYSYLFDVDRPTVSEIRERHPNPLDLNLYEGVTDEDVADAILTRGRERGVIIPREYRFWDREAVVKQRGKRLPLNIPQRFRRYGPDVCISKYYTRQKDMKEDRITPRKAFGSLGSYGHELLHGAYRGIGYWNPRSRTHKLIPFDVPVEGQAFRKLFEDEINIRYQHGDCYVEVPSLSRAGREYIFRLSVLPVTGRKSEFFVEWLMTRGECGCEDASFRGMRGKIRQDEEPDAYAGVFKYANPEFQWCRHSWGALEAAQENSFIDPKAKPFRVKFPEATGLKEPWYVFKTRTLIGDQKRARRPSKAETLIMCGKIIGCMGLGEAFDLSENV